MYPFELYWPAVHATFVSERSRTTGKSPRASQSSFSFSSSAEFAAVASYTSLVTSTDSARRAGAAASDAIKSLSSPLPLFPPREGEARARPELSRGGCSCQGIDDDEGSARAERTTVARIIVVGTRFRSQIPQKKNVPSYLTGGLRWPKQLNPGFPTLGRDTSP